MSAQKAIGTELLGVIKIVFLDAVTKNIKAVIAFKSMHVWVFYRTVFPLMAVVLYGSLQSSVELIQSLK